MRQVTVDLREVRVLTVSSLDKSHPAKPFKVIDDGTPYWKLEKGCLFVRRYSFCSSTQPNGQIQLNGWVNLGRSDRYDMGSLAELLPLWSDLVHQPAADHDSVLRCD